MIQISCSTVLVQPSSFPSNAKMSWKASMRSHTTTAFQGVQLLRPFRSNFSKSFFCHSATDRGCCLSSAPRTASISRDMSVGGAGNVETTLATCTPFFRKITDSDMFLTTTDTLLLLILSLVYACRTCNPAGRGHTSPDLVSPTLKGVTMPWALLPMSGLTLHSSIWVWNGPNLTFSFMKTGLSRSQLAQGSSAVAPCSLGPSPATPGSSTTVPHRLNKQDVLTIAQGVESLSISLSLITLMILPSVQVPITIGTCRENSDSSDMTRKTLSSS